MVGRAPRAFRRSARFALAGALALALPARASPGEPRPWAEGVPADRQASAFRLFDAGNRAFEQSKYGEALQNYGAALRFWDHPIIHFNMAVCFIHLDRPVEAYEHLTRAMVYGSGPLGEDLHSQGLTYEKLLGGRLARVQVSCRQAGVEVSLDGRRLLTCPGKSERVVMPGTHQLVARKPGHLTDARDLSLLPARIQIENIALARADSTATMERRWRTWMPWAVVGSGAAVAVAGVVLRQVASSDFDEYDEAFARACPDGCAADEIPSSVQAIRDRARLENGAAIAALATGSLAVGVGAVLLYLNQPRPVSTGERSGRLAPMLAPRAIGLTVELPF